MSALENAKAMGKDGVILSGWTAIASYNGKAGPWWTRSVGGFSTGVTNVDKIGGLTGDGGYQNAYGIRPALWINLAGE